MGVWVGGNMRPGWRKKWEGLPLLAGDYSWLKAVMKLQGCNKQGFHPGEEKTKNSNPNQTSEHKNNNKKRNFNQTKQLQKPHMDHIFNKQFFLQD